MGRLLDEDAVIKALECWRKAFRENSHYVSASDLSLVIKDVRELPSAQPEPQEGHWKKDETDDCPPVFRQFRICSVCGAIETSETNYCPNCGARMKGVSNERTD